MDRSWLLGLIATCGLLASPVLAQEDGCSFKNGTVLDPEFEYTQEDGCTVCVCGPGTGDNTYDWACSSDACASGCALGNGTVYDPEFEYTQEDGCTVCVCGPGTGDNTYDWACSSEACASGCALGNGTVYDPEFEYTQEDGCTVCVCGPGTGDNSYDWACSSEACEPGCQEDGKRYLEGEVVPRESPCVACGCFLIDGTYNIECYVFSCRVPECENPIQDAKRCCPFCPISGCALGNGTVYDPEFEYTQEDGCTECVCGPGTGDNTYDWACSSDACASGCALGNGTVYDPEFEYTQEDGCTVCVCGPGTGDNTYDWACSSEACGTGCQEDGKRYVEGDDVPRESPCETCTCTLTDGTYTIECAVYDCAPPECENPIRDPKICCSFCPKTCTLENGTALEEGDSYKDDCNICTCKEGRIICTDDTCDDGDDVCNIALFRECFIEHVEVSLYTMVGQDRLAMCKARLSLERCVHKYLESCEDVNGGILTSILRPYATVLGAISRLNCDTDFMDDNYGGQHDYVAIARATKCMVDYTKVAVYGSLISICRQGKLALRCVAEATYSCSDSNKNMFSMVTDTITMTLKTVCSMESCNLGMAERCLAEGYAVNGAQLYREHGSRLSCGFITEALMCATGHVVQCGMKFEELGKDWLDEVDGNKRDQNEDSDLDGDASRKDTDGEKENEEEERGMDSLFSERLVVLVNQLEVDHKELLEMTERSRSDSDDDTTDNDDEKMPNIPGPSDSDSEPKDDSVYDRKLPGGESDSDTASVDGMSRDDFDKGRELLHAHFDDLHRRIGSLVDKLDDSEPGKGEYLRDTFSGLYERVQHLKASMEGDDDGFRVQMTIKRLQVIHDNLAELVKDVENSGAEEGTDFTNVRSDIDNLKETVRVQMEAEMEKMRERLYHVRDSLEFLHGKLEGFCLDFGKEGMAEGRRPELRVFDILGTLIASPFSNSTQICRLVKSVKMYMVEVRSGDKEMDVEDLDEFLHSAASSLEYIDMIISPVCETKEEAGSTNGGGEEEEEKCVPPSEEDPVCDQAGLTKCVSLGALDQLVADVQYGGLEEDPTRPCSTARDILICVFDNTKDCKDGTDDFITIKLAERLKNQVMSIVPAAFNCDFSLPEVKECEPEKKCSPREAAMECFTEPGEFADVCRVVKEKWLPCIETKMEVCTVSTDFTIVQTLMKISLDKYEDRLTECDLDPDLLLDDVTRPEAECSVSFYSTLVTSLPMHDNFNSALCKAMSASYDCEKTQSFPYIVEMFASQHARFYEEFWEMNCVEDKEGEGDAGDAVDDVTLPDFTGCDVNAAVVTIGHFMNLAYRSYGILSQTEEYAEACSETPYIELQSQISAITANCNPGAVEVINGSLPFLKSYHAEYCPFQPERKPGTCSVAGAKDCTGKFGMLMALASPHEDICPHLKSGLDCVAGFSVECDEDSKAQIEEELRYIHSIVGNVECKRPSWCETEETGDEGTEGQEGEQGEAQDQTEPVEGGEADGPPEDGLPFCAAPSTCSVQWRDCLPENSTCDESVQCIENVVSDCPDFIKLVIKANVMDYQNSLKADEPAEGAESCDLVSPSLAGVASGDFDSCYAAFTEADVGSVNGFSDALTAFVECIGADFENDLLTVELGRLKATVQIYKHFLMDFVPEKENGERGEETEGDNEPTEGQDDNPAGDGNEETVIDGQEGQTDTDAGDGEGNDGNTEDVSDTCDELINAKKYLRDIAKLILVMPVAPFSDKAYICTTGHTLYVKASDYIKGCKNDESKELYKLLSLTGKLIDNMAFCSKDPHPRVCNPQAATACLSQLSQSLVDNHDEFILNTCSDVISVESCVYSNTMGCDWLTRGYTEHMASTVLSVVQGACSPKPEPKPDMSCTAIGEDKMCDLSGAASCLVKLQTSLMCEKPDWKEICPTVPFVKTCVERHLHGCSGQETAVFEKLSLELMAKVKDHCLEVKCDVCGAEKCMSDLDKKREDEDFCWYAMEAKKCVRSMTQSCQEIHAGEVWEKSEQLFNMVDEHCTKKVYTCLDDFKYTAFALLSYSGPSIGEIDIEYTESERSSKDESAQSDSQSIDSTEPSETSNSGGAGKSVKSSQTSGSANGAKKSKNSKTSDSANGAKTVKSSQTSDSTSGAKKVKSSKSVDSKKVENSQSTDSKRGSKSVKSSQRSESTDEKSEKSGEMNDYCDIYYYEDEPWSFADGIDIGVLDIIKKWNNEDDGSSEESGSDSSESVDTNGSDSGASDDTIVSSRDDNGDGSTMTDEVKGSTNDEDDDDDMDKDGDKDNDNDLKRRRKRSATNDESKEKSSGNSDENSAGQPNSNSTRSSNENSARKASKGSSSRSNQGKPDKDSGSSNRGENSGSRPTENNSGGSKRPNKCLRKRTVPLHPDLYRLCYRLHTSWSCLESHAFMMDDSISEPVKTSLYMVMQAVKQKCNVAPLQCHSCVKADSEEACNAEPIETCAFNKLMCQTVIRPGKGKGSISKGCKNPMACKERCAEGQTCEKCCVGPLCNKYFDPPVPSMSQEYCDVTGPTYCALDFAMSLIKRERMDCKQYYEALECISQKSEGCYPSEMSKVMTLITKHMKTSKSWARCQAEIRACNCGGYAVASLDRVYLNQYSNSSTRCNHFGSVYEMMKYSDWGRCMPTDHQYVSSSLHLFWSTQSSVCLKLEEEKDTQRFCPLPTSYSADISNCPMDCKLDEDCRTEEGTKMCCNNGCGGKSCMDSVEEDPFTEEPRPGYCPIPEPGEVGICQVECQIDSECTNVAHKCCKNACGGGICTQPLEEEPEQPLECLDDAPVVRCVDDPCAANACPNFKDAECRANYCGGCNALFYVDNEDVTSRCHEPVTVDPLCLLPKKVGLCKALFPSWYFDVSAGECLQFNYGGCGGNENRFGTLEECQTQCGNEIPTCYQPMDVGYCKAMLPSWYFDGRSGTCKEFYYGGCGGNDNRFTTKEQCQGQCANVTQLESDCEMVRQQVIQTLKDHFVPLLQLLDGKADLQCRLMKNEYRVKVSELFKLCPLADKVTEIMEEAEQMLAFNWTMCEDEMTDDKADGKDDEEEKKVCKTFAEVQESCTLPEITDDYDCTDLVAYIACVQPMTEACNIFQLKQFHQILSNHIAALSDKSIKCNVDIPDMSENALSPVAKCAMSFVELSRDVLMTKFIPYGRVSEMCRAAEDFQACIYRIPSLPGKSHVSRMLDVADKVQKTFCSETVKPSTDRQLCYQCKDAESNLDCNEEPQEICPINKLSCVSRVNLKAEGYTITKGCENPAEVANSDKWVVTQDGVFYQYVCNGAFCNGRDPMKVKKDDEEGDDGDAGEEDAILYSSCFDVYTKDQNAANGSYSLVNTAGEVYMAYCEFYPGYMYTYIAPTYISSLNIDTLYNNKKEVLIRHQLEDGTQKESLIGQIESYSEWDISVQYRSYEGYQKLVNTDMGPFVYIGFIPVEIGKEHKGDTQGYSVNGKDHTFSNCDGNANSYFVLLFNENGKTFTGYSVNSQPLMTKWIDDAFTVPNERQLPDEYFSLFEMHMGGCGGFLTTGNTPTVKGATIGLRYDFVEPAPNCLYKSIGENVYGMLYKATVFPFLNEEDKGSFCSGVDLDTFSSVSESCSEDISGRVTRVLDSFDSISLDICEQPLLSDKGDNEGEDEGTGCDWKKCLAPIIPYFRSVSFPDECVHVTKGFECLDDLLPTCDQNDRVSVATGVLSVLRRIKGPLYCDIDLNEKICSASKIDPKTVCDIDAAKACEIEYAVNGFEIPSEQCLLNKNHFACVTYYLDNCEEKTSEMDVILLSVQANNCENDSISATFEPASCDAYVPFPCIAFGVVDIYFTHITALFDNPTEDTCLDASSEMAEGDLDGCPSPLAAVADIAISVALEEIHTCSYSSFSVYPSTTWSTCVSSFIETTITAFTNGESYCTGMTTFSACLENADMYTLENHLMGSVLAWLEETIKANCSDFDDMKEEVVETEGCFPVRAAHCQLTYGLLYAFSPLMSDKEKTGICKTEFMDLIAAQCNTFSSGCDRTSLSMVRLSQLTNSFSTLSNSLTICTEPEEPIWPEPELKCRPAEAMGLLSQFGLSLSECGESNKLRDRVCWSVEIIKVAVHSRIVGCPDVVQSQVSGAWQEMSMLADAVCGREEELYEGTPPCIEYAYMPKTETCRADKALTCLINLEKKVFAVETTETRFCMSLRHAVKCNLDYTSGCDEQFKKVLTPLTEKVLKKFEGRCESTWCPVTPEPTKCDMETAISCMNKLRTSIEKGEDKICQLAEETKVCLKKASIDCDLDRELKISQMLMSVQVISSTSCARLDDKDVDVSGCLEKYAMKAQALLKYGYNTDFGDEMTDKEDTNRDDVDGGDSTNNDDDDNDNMIGSKRRNEQGSKASENNDNMIGSKGKNEQGSKASKNNDSMIGSKGKPSSRGSWVNEESRRFEDNVLDMCRETKEAWMCVEGSLQVLDPKTKSILSLLLNGIKMAIEEKCRPRHCHSCVGLDDNDDCNAQPTCACPAKQSMCYTSYEDGVYTKGCSAKCEECEGKEDCYCCEGHKCNNVGSIKPEDQCDVSKAMTCAFELVTVSITTPEMSYSTIQAKLECVMEYTIGCTSYNYRHLYTVCLTIVDLFRVGECVTQYGDPVCGTSAILSLGYLMRNKYSDKMSLCSQYEVTTDVVNNVMYDEICKEEDFQPIVESVDIAETQLTGYCTVPVDTDNVCDVKTAISECIESKSWRSPSDASECSDEMFTAFKTCCISYTRGCHAFQRSGIYLQVQRHLEQARLNCNQDFVITTDLDALRAEIFLVDSYSQLSNFYSEFVVNVQTSMIGSLNFNEEICNYLSYLKGNVTELELPTLLDLFSTADNKGIFDELDEICKDTTIDENTVVEECKQLELDIILVLDGSLSVKPEGFEKMREFIMNLAQLADMESGAVRFGAIQFAEELYDEFYLDSFLEEVDGKMVQNKEKVLEYFENMIYQNKLKTNTGGAIERARDVYFSEARGARPGVPKHMLVITDGKSNYGPDSVEEAIVTRRANIHLFAVGVRMNRADAIEEMYAIASEPSSLNYLNIDEFDKLLESLTKIFIWFCRVDTPSECEYTKIVYELSDTMMLSFSSSYTGYKDKSEICSLVSAVSSSVESLSATCAPYQNKAIRIVQAMIRVLTWKSCLTVSEEPQGSCDLVKVSYCISDSTQFLRAAAIDDHTVCSVVANLVSCLNYYGATCEDKTFIIKEMSFYATLIRSRCPDMVAQLQCWGILSDETEEDTGDENEAQTCDLVAITTDCLSETADLSIADFILDPCNGLLGLVNEVMKCARDAFVAAACDKTKFGELMKSIVNDNKHFKDIYDAAMSVKGCPMPEIVELPEGYGVVEPPECAVVDVCDIGQVKQCIEDLPELDSDDCESIGAVKACLVNLAGCTSIEYKVFMSSLRMTLMANFDAECLDSQGIEWTRPDGYSDSFVACLDDLVNGIMDSGRSTCDIFSAYLVCLDNINDILVGPSLFARQYQVLSTVLGSYCSDEPVGEVEIGEECSISQSDVTCIAKYTEMVASGLALSTHGKTELCAKHYGRLECAENIGSQCKKGTPAGRLWEVYQVAEIMVYSGDICVDVPHICSVQTAMACISLLSQSVSRHNYLSGENDAVCSQLMYARKCLKTTLNTCDLETQNAIIGTFEEVECLALDICTTGQYKPEDPQGEPVKCIDRTVVTADYECSPYRAMEYIREMGGIVMNPFLPAQRRVAASCLAFSVGMQGVYNHIYNCGPIVTGLIDGLVGPTIVAARAHGCQTEIKTPCKEVEDCGVIKARACIQEFRSNLDIYKTEGAQRVCLEQEAVRRCLDANIETCSERVRIEMESEYQSILTDTVCVDNFDSCVTQYIHYLYKILDWKAVILPVEPETEKSKETEKVSSKKTPATEKKSSGKTAKSASEKTEKTAKSASEKTAKSASEKTAKSASEKTEKTAKSASEKTAKSASEKTEKTAKTASKERDRRSATKKTASKDTKSASKNTKTASKNTETASKDTTKTASKNTKTASKTASKNTKSAKSTKSASTPASEKSVEEIDYTLRLIELEEYCLQFNQAWGCIGENWESVGPSFRGFVQVAFGTYHATAMSICNGPRPGYCKARNGKLDERVCETDGDCGVGSRKCCGVGLAGTICVDPEPVPEGCYSRFVVAMRLSVKLVQSLYQNDDNGLMFCSLYTEISENIYSTLTIEVCPNEFIGIVSSILTASEEVNTLLCIIPPEPPRPCIIDDVDACLAVYNKASEIVQMKQKCSLFGTLELCAEATLKQCDGENAEDKLVIDSITAKVAEVKNFLICMIMPEFEFGVIGNIVVEEGDVPGKDFPLVLKQNPAELIVGQECSMRFNFDLIEDDMPKCKNKRPIRQLLIGNLCDMTFTKDNWDIPQNVSLTARIDGKRDGTRKATFRMIATLVCDGTDIQNAPIKDYVVSIKDSDRKSVCQSVNDPHLTTFDGYKYDNHISGEFVLYKHTQYPFEVRVFYYPCFTSDSKEAKCNCGVMVICGDDTFTIFKCKGRNFPEVGKPTMWQNDDLMEGFRVFKLKKGKKFKVRFPTGTEVDINMSKRKKARTSKVDFISVQIKPSAVDWGRTQGLCGTYDNDQSNDLLCPDGTMYDPNSVPKPKREKGKPQPNDFNKCWQVSQGDYSFQGVPANPSLPALTSFCLRSEDNPDETCTCNLDNLVEQCSDLSGNEITTTMQQGASLLRRRKRAIGDITDDIEGYDPTVVPPEKDFPTPNGITEEQATTVCVNEITNADFFEACQDQFEPGEVDTKIEDCKTDILEEDDIASPFVIAGREALREKCVSVASSSTNETLVDNIIDSNSCDNGCSGQGTCLNGTCICNDGFVDTDCSININDPPTADQLASAICTSVQQGECATATVEGNDFVDPAYCHYETVEVTETGIIKSGNQTSKPAIFDSFEEVSCDLSSTGSLSLHAVLVSVSNNNGTRTSQSDQLLFIAYDPICWSCSVDTENQIGTCRREGASCLEDGVCYRPTDPKVGSPCYLCDAFTGTMVYYVSENCSAPTTTADPSQASSKAREMDDAAVIGLSAGIAVLVLVVIGIVAAVLILRRRGSRSESNSLTRKSRGSTTSSEDNDRFQEVVYPAYPNYGYYGYGQDMFIEAPAEMFAGHIPKRQDTRQSSSRHSDPTHRPEDHYDNRRSGQHGRRDRIESNS